MGNHIPVGGSRWQVAGMMRAGTGMTRRIGWGPRQRGWHGGRLGEQAAGFDIDAGEG